MLIIDGKFSGFVKKHNYRYRSLKGHGHMDNAMFKVNYDVEALQQKAELLLQSACVTTDIHPPEATQFKPTPTLFFPVARG